MPTTCYTVGWVLIAYNCVSGNAYYIEFLIIMFPNITTYRPGYSWLYNAFLIFEHLQLASTQSVLISI